MKENRDQTLYEVNKNLLCPTCAHCVKGCKVVLDYPDMGVDFYCPRFYPAERYHKEYKAVYVSWFGLYRGLDGKFKKHLVKYHKPLLG